MSHIYENDTKPILSDPPYLLQFILSVALFHVELVRCPARASRDWPGTSAGA